MNVCLLITQWIKCLVLICPHPHEGYFILISLGFEMCIKYDPSLCTESRSRGLKGVFPGNPTVLSHVRKQQTASALVMIRGDLHTSGSKENKQIGQGCAGCQTQLPHRRNSRGRLLGNRKLVDMKCPFLIKKKKKSLHEDVYSLIFKVDFVISSENV